MPSRRSLRCRRRTFFARCPVYGQRLTVEYTDGCTITCFLQYFHFRTLLGSWVLLLQAPVAPITIMIWHHCATVYLQLILPPMVAKGATRGRAGRFSSRHPGCPRQARLAGRRCPRGGEAGFRVVPRTQRPRERQLRDLELRGDILQRLLGRPDIFPAPAAAEPVVRVLRHATRVLRQEVRPDVLTPPAKASRWRAAAAGAAAPSRAAAAVAQVLLLLLLLLLQLLLG